MKTTATYYYLDGPVRGNCGHKHRTLSGAAKCLNSDIDGCVSQGGYSDRQFQVAGETTMEDFFLAEREFRAYMEGQLS